MHDKTFTECNECEGPLGLEQQSLLRGILDNSDAAIFVCDERACLRSVNKGYERIIGRSAAEVVGCRAHDIFAKEDADWMLQVVQEVHSKGRPRTIEASYTVQGQVRTFLNALFPLTDTSGRITYVGGIVTEITERKRYESELRIAHRALLVLGEANRAVIYGQEELPLAREVCRAIVRKGGYRLAWVGLTDEEDGLKPVAQFGLLEEQEEADVLGRLALLHARQKGAPLYALQRGAPSVARKLRDDPLFAPLREDARRLGFESALALPLRSGHAVLGVLAIYAPEPDAFDTRETELLSKLGDSLAHGIRSLRAEQKRREAEEALRKSEARYRALFKRSSEGVLVHDLQGAILEANQAAQAMSGYSIDELRTMNPTQLLHPDEGHTFTSNLESVLGGEFEGAEHRALRKDGSELTVMVRARLVAPDMIQAVLQDVTERKRAEEALLRERSIMRTILEDTLAGYWDWDVTNGVNYMSPNLKRMFGYEDHELENVPETWQRLIFPEDLPGVLELFGKHVASRGRIPFTQEVRYRHRDGSTVWVICSGRVIEWTADGAPLRVVGCHIDITQSKRAAERLQQSEARFRALFENSSEGVFLHDLQGGILDVNQAAQAMFGYSLEEFLEMHTSQLVHPDDAWRVHQDFASVARNEVQSHEYRGRRKDGSEFIMVASGKQVVEGLVQGVVRDITETKRAERALQQSEARYRAVVEDQTEVISRFLPDGTFTFVNDVYCRVFGKKREELLGRAWHPVCSDEDLPRVERAVASLSPDNPVVLVENRVVDGQGQVLWMQFMNRAFFDEDGALLEIQSVGRDITRQKELQAEAVRSARLASLGELAAGVAHEVNNPITGIINCAQLLADEARQEGRNPRYPDLVLHEGRRVAQIVRSLLSLAREEDEQGTPLDPLEPLEPLRLALDLVQAQMEKAGVRIEMKAASDLPRVVAGKSRMQQVFLNLLRNAHQSLQRARLHSGEPGRLDIEVLRGELEGAPAVVYRLLDNGEGLSPGEPSRYFAPFYSTKPHGEGTGLGLSISRSIVEHYGGRIELENRASGGATAVVCLPAVDEVVQ